MTVANLSIADALGVFNVIQLSDSDHSKSTPILITAIF